MRRLRIIAKINRVARSDLPPFTISRCVYDWLYENDYTFLAFAFFSEIKCLIKSAENGVEEDRLILSEISYSVCYAFLATFQII